MDVFYINLDSAADRRTSLELNFVAHAPVGWRLNRFPAIDAVGANGAGAPGALRAAEKACFLSHKSLIGSRTAASGHLFVVEDDVLFGPSAFASIDRLLANQFRGLDWDIIFTDVCIPQPATMLDLFKLRRRLEAENQVGLLNLARTPFAGSTAYLVNAGAVQKLKALLEAETVLDTPYDLCLARLALEGRLKAFASFPFLTSLSDAAASSSIQDDGQDSDLVWNAFRKMMWIDRDLTAQTQAIRRIDEQLGDESSRLFALLISAMVSGRYRDKQSPPSAPSGPG